jgi:hypothetical protein
MSKIEKTIARQQQRLVQHIHSNHAPLTKLTFRIKDGDFYEAHQQLRVISARYTKQENWDAAIDILSSGAKALLDAGQGGSGGDLCLLLLDVYGKAELKPDAKSKARLLTLLRSFPPAEVTRKRFVNEAIACVG